MKYFVCLLMGPPLRVFTFSVYIFLNLSNFFNCFNGSIFLPVPVPHLERTLNVRRFRVGFYRCHIFSAGSGSYSTKLMLTVPVIGLSFLFVNSLINLQKLLHLHTSTYTFNLF